MSGLSASDPTLLAPAVRGCLEACHRCRALVEIISKKEPEVVTKAYQAIGRHLRHCLDHFVCLTRGLDSGVVDYDARDRDEQVEIDPQQFLSTLETVEQQLWVMDPNTLRRKLTLSQESAPGKRSEMDSNVERELVFLSGHTIHHLAIMMLLVKREGVDVPEDLAVAYSTATYLARKSSGISGLGHA